MDASDMSQRHRLMDQSLEAKFLLFEHLRSLFDESPPLAVAKDPGSGWSLNLSMKDGAMV